METRQATKFGKKTGAFSSASYVEALRVDTRGYGIQGKTLILIKNTSGALTGGGVGPTPMNYKIDGYPADWDGTQSGLSVAIKAATSIAYGASTVTSTDVDKGYAAVVVSVACDNSTGAGSGPTPGTYQVEFVTY